MPVKFIILGIASSLTSEFFSSPISTSTEKQEPPPTVDLLSSKWLRLSDKRLAKARPRPKPLLLSRSLFSI